MPDLLLELFSEEIPARMQRKAAQDLQSLVTNALVERGLLYEGARAWATPRRLTLHVAGLPAVGKDVREERKGPRVGAPDGAIEGFLKSAGLSSIDQAQVVSDPKKGEFYVAVIEKPGQPTIDVLAQALPRIIQNFLAQIHALGRGFSKARRHALGAAAARHPRHLRTRN